MTPTEKPSSDIPMWVVLVAILVMLGMAAVTASVLLRDSHERGYPARWDSRVAPYVQVAQRERGLFFMHPVAVRFLPPAEYEKSIAADENELSPEDRTEIEQFTGLMRAFGLLAGDVDLFDAVNDFSTGGTLAYYSFADERITVRGEKVTPAVRGTLVHELTHVLQDQHFKVGDQMEKLRKADKADGTSRATILTAVVEGDAERVESLYRDSLKPRNRKALDAASNRASREARQRIEEVPKVILTMMTSPYTLGSGLVQTVATNGGNTKVDELFRNLPENESALLDPFQAMSSQKTAEVEVPELERGEKKFDSGEFGALAWYLMLSERLPLQDALTSVDGWGGDAYVGFERKGSYCARLAYKGDTPQDTKRMQSALRRWDAAAPASPTKVSRAGNLVRFETCDPGKTAKVGKDASVDAVTLVTTRTSIGLGMMRMDVPRRMARCVAGSLVQTYPVAQLVDPKFGANDPAVQAKLGELAADCRR